MTDNTRFGTASSSNWGKLMTVDKSGKGWGKPAQKYIKQIQYEIQLKRALNPERDSRPTSWGKFVEKVAFDLLPTSYILISQERLFHPKYPFWSGMPDLKKTFVTGDVKCPFSLEVFMDKCTSLDNVDDYKAQYPDDYYQHISNAILLRENGHPVTHFEAIIYCPYRTELANIRDLAFNADIDIQRSCQWIYYAEDNELPYLLEDSGLKNLNIFSFPIPEEDVELMISKAELLKPLIQ